MELVAKENQKYPESSICRSPRLRMHFSQFVSYLREAAGIDICCNCSLQLARLWSDFLFVSAGSGGWTSSSSYQHRHFVIVELISPNPKVHAAAADP